MSQEVQTHDKLGRVAVVVIWCTVQVKLLQSWGSDLATDRLYQCKKIYMTCWILEMHFFSSWCPLGLQLQIIFITSD